MNFLEFLEELFGIAQKAAPIVEAVDPKLAAPINAAEGVVTDVENAAKSL
jgi:hypothetical protein